MVPIKELRERSHVGEVTHTSSGLLDLIKLPLYWTNTLVVKVNNTSASDLA